jgi:hypothetical protein
VGLVYALRDIRRLLVVSYQHGAAAIVDAVVGIVVPDALDRFTCHLLEVNDRMGGNFAGQDH